MISGASGFNPVEAAIGNMRKHMSAHWLAMISHMVFKSWSYIQKVEQLSLRCEEKQLTNLGFKWNKGGIICKQNNSFLHELKNIPHIPLCETNKYKSNIEIDEIEFQWYNVLAVSFFPSGSSYNLWNPQYNILTLHTYIHTYIYIYI